MSIRLKSNRKFVFTKRSLDTLPPHDKVKQKGNGTEYTDASCPGLKAITGTSGRVHFLHRYTFRGKKQGLALGEWLSGHTSIDSIRKKVYAQKAMIGNGENPKAEREKQKQMLNFAEYATEHYLPHAKQHKKTWREDVWKIEKVLVPALGSNQLDTITTRQLTALHNAEKERTSAVSSNHMLRLLGRMLRLAHEWDYLAEVPRQPRKFKEQSRERFLSRDELVGFLNALDDIEDTGSVSAIRMLLLTGCRRNEILSLPKMDVNVTEGWIHLAETKTGRSRTVFLSAPAKEVLAGQLGRADGSEFLFPGARASFLKDIRKPFHRACAAAGIDNFRIHDLRHTFCSYAAMNSSLAQVSKVVGHADVSMTNRYTHHMSDELRKTADQAALEMLKPVA